VGKGGALDQSIACPAATSWDVALCANAMANSMNMMTTKNASAATVDMDRPRLTTMHPNGLGFSSSLPSTRLSFRTGPPPTRRMLL
jgi:hypothetical protein